jgi:enolase
LREVENALIERGGKNLEDIGANALLPVSWALWRLAAALRQMSLCDYVREYEPELRHPKRPHACFTLFGSADRAGLGRDQGIDLAEIMVVPLATPNYRDALAQGDRIEATLFEQLRARYGEERVKKSDRSGYCVLGMRDNATAIRHVHEAIERSGLIPGQEVALALNFGAGRMFDAQAGGYRFEDGVFSSADMLALLRELSRRYPNKLYLCEDVLAPDDWDGWELLHTELGDHAYHVIGADLFQSQVKRLRRGVNNGSAENVAVCVAQAGSVGAALELVRYAKQNSVGHTFYREPGDAHEFGSADLALATGAQALRAGRPGADHEGAGVGRGTYARLVEIEETAR